jgi:cytochrome c
MAASTSSVGLTSSGDGPEKNAPALIGAGMMGDRADIIFADPSAISAFIAAKCE